MKRTTHPGKQTSSHARTRVTPQSLLRGDYLPLGKACELLGDMDTRTLQRFIDELRLKTFAHPTDGRIILLRSTDVAKIAKISDRPVSLPEARPARSSSRAELGHQLAALRQELERVVADYERQLAALRQEHATEVEDLHRRIRELTQPGSPGG